MREPAELVELAGQSRHVELAAFGWYLPAGHNAQANAKAPVGEVPSEKEPG